MKKSRKISVLAVLAVAVSLCLAGSASAASPARVYLRTADHFAILTGAGITDAGASRILAGDVGNPAGAQIVLLTSQLTAPGIIYDSDGGYGSGAVTDGPLLLQAAQDWTDAYDDAAGRPVTEDLSTHDLNEKPLIPGVYRFTSAAQLTGQLTLNANGEADPVWIFQIVSDLTTAPGSSVIFTNTGTGGRLGTPCDVFWQVGSSVTLDTTTSFVGIIMAYDLIEMHDGATLLGSVLSETDQVTLINNDITKGPCALAPSPTPVPAPGSGLPYTGEIVSYMKSNPWNIAMLAGVFTVSILFAASLLFMVARRKRQTS